MKKKIIMLILLLFLASGCDAVYILELKSNNINETMEIHNYNKSSWKNGNPSYQDLIDMFITGTIATDYRKEIPESNEEVAGVNYYNITKISTKEDLGISYHSPFTLENYIYSTIVFSNTEFSKFKYNKDRITFYSGEKIKSFVSYPDLNNLTVKFVTNHTVINNNADEIRDGAYYWYFDRNNYDNKKINLEVGTEYTEEKLKVLEVDEEGYFGVKTLVAIYAIIGIVLVIITGIIFFKVKNSNQ